MNNTIDISVPGYASRAVEVLEAGGYEAWLVGGCVRDAVLGRETHDIDIATSARWEEVERLMLAAGFAVHRTGTKHGTVTVTLDGEVLEITTYRSDGTYSDGRHPDGVSFVATIEEDLARRDFTVNALAYHPRRGLLDCHGGLADLRSGVIRAVGDPTRRFAEDGLRILRGCRFAAQLGFEIEPVTLSAMKARKMMLSRVSAERITHELDALLLGEHVHDALMETVDVLVAVMPEIAACRGFDQHSPYHCYDVWEHICWVVQNAPSTRLARWAALFHDIGKPAACFFEGERAHFYGHAELSCIMAREIMERLLVAPTFVDRVVLLVRMHDDEIPPTPRGVRRALARIDGDLELFEALLGLKRADAMAHSALGQKRVKAADELSDVFNEVMASDAAFTVKQLAVGGRDLIAAGVAEGPRIGELLDIALEAVIDGRVANDRDVLLDMLSGSIDERSKG